MSERTDYLSEVTVTGRIFGRKEEIPDSMSHVRAYPYSPESIALQLRGCARDGKGGATRPVYLTALIDEEEVENLIDAFTRILAYRRASKEAAHA